MIVNLVRLKCSNAAAYDVQAAQNRFTAAVKRAKVNEEFAGEAQEVFEEFINWLITPPGYVVIEGVTYYMALYAEGIGDDWDMWPTYLRGLIEDVPDIVAALEITVTPSSSSFGGPVPPKDILK